MKRQNERRGHRASSALERRLRFGFVAAATLASAAAAGLVACATSDDSGEAREPDPHVIVVDDAGAEASSDADASAPCVTDCEYFPPTCSEDVLCSNGLFDPSGADPIDDRVTIQVIRGRSASDVWVVGGGGPAPLRRAGVDSFGATEELALASGRHAVVRDALATRRV